MKIYMIRHGATKGNIEHRYVGVTDEGLLPGEYSILEAGRGKYKDMCQNDRVYVSPMQRCRETAGALFPEAFQVEIDDFRECDFGEFEYMNYEELNGNPVYQRFIDTEGRCGFPGGETREEFQNRCVRGMLGVFDDCQERASDIVMVVHGGTIMSILDIYSEPHRDYYDWQVRNCHGYVAELVKNGNGEIRFTDVVEICLKE